MKKNSSALSPALLRRLIEAHCPLDPEIEQQAHEAYHGLEVCQSGSVIESWIFDLNSGGMGLVISCRINNTSNKNLRIKQFRAQLPWDDPSFCWLEDPHGKWPCEMVYEFPKLSRLEFEREAVLNHRIGSEGLLLLPGESIDGFLLAVGEMPIPEQYLHRHGMPIRLQVFDARGQQYSGEFKILVDREWKMARASRRPRVSKAVA